VFIKTYMQIVMARLWPSAHSLGQLALFIMDNSRVVVYNLFMQISSWTSHRSAAGSRGGGAV